MKKYILLMSCFLMLLSYGQQSSADVLIKNGTLIDGLGNPPMKANVAIRNGLMEVLKQGEEIEAKNTIDATGLIVAPGFIDVHNHSDWNLQGEEKKLNEGFVRQGVTTIVGGPDGYWAPSTIKELIEVYKAKGIGTNVAFYVGHNGIRKEVMQKDQNRAPTAKELEQMKKLVREGMEMGAVGLSTGLMYEPGIYSNTDELIALSKEVALYNGIYDSHVRNPVHAFVKSHREVIEISTTAKIPGKLGHLKAVGLHNEGAIDEIISMVEEYRNEGFTIVSDQYPYDGAQTEKLEHIIRFPSDMEEARAISKQQNSGNDVEALVLLKSVLTDEAKRAKIKQVSEEGENGGFAWLKATGYSSMRITSSKDYPELVGKYLSEVAEEKNMDPFESLCDLILNASESSFITLGGINEKDVQKLLVQPWNMIASDGSYVKQSNMSTGHPRSTGTFPKVLGHYSRDLKLLSLEEAVRKMTSLPADVLGFKNRGRIKDGMPADIVIFDPETIIDNSTFEQPNLYATGVIHVFVNGVAVLKNKEMTGKASGKYLSLIEASNSN